MKEKSYVMVKPEFANNREVIAEVKRRLEANGITILESSYIKYDVARAQRHYHEHFRGSYENAKGFYKELEDYITSDKAYGMIVEGEDAIAKIRALAGPTIKKNKETGELVLPPVGTIRRDIPTALGQELDMTKNVIHSSDGAAAAELEGTIFAELKKEYEKKSDRTK